MIGMDSETLMTAFLFSDVRMCGLEMTFTRLSAARAVIMAKNSLAERAMAVNPPAGRMIGRLGVGNGGLSFPPPMLPGEMFDEKRRKFPVRIAQSMPSL